MIKGIAIVKFTTNKSSCNSFGNSKIHILANTTNVIKAVTTRKREKLSNLPCCFCVPETSNYVLFAFNFAVNHPAANFSVEAFMNRLSLYVYIIN